MESRNQASLDGAELMLSDVASRFMAAAHQSFETAGDASPASGWQHPPSFVCPISQQCLHDPVVLADGHTYERRHIERWLQEHSTSPVSNEELPQKAIFPNHALRNAISEYFQQVFSVHRSAIRKSIKGPDSTFDSLGFNGPLLRTIDALMQCSVLMNADMSTEVVLRQIMDEAKTLLGAEVASVFLVDKERQELYSNVNSTNGELRVPINAGIAGHVATTGTPVIIDDAYADHRFNKANDMKTGFRTRNMMCVPLKVKKDGVIGVVQLINKADTGVFSHPHVGASSANDAHPFTAQDLQFLQVFAAQAATAITNGGLELRDPQSELPLEASGATDSKFGLVQCPGQSSPGDFSVQKSASASMCTPSKAKPPSSNPSDTQNATCSTTVAMHDPQCDNGDLAATRALAKQKQLRYRRPSLTLAVKEDGHARYKAKRVLAMLVDSFENWQFDAFAFSEITDGKPLSTLGMYLFDRLGIMDHFQFDSGKVKVFLEQIECGYDDANQYHNRAHAASVLHAMHALLEHGGVAKAIAAAFNGTEDSACQDAYLLTLASLLAAAIHDFEHLGVSNEFLVRTCDKRAMLYNDRHVNENHHVAAAFAVLSRPECNFLASMPQKQWRRLRDLVIELVVSTDMAIGGKLLKSFDDAFAAQSDGGKALAALTSPKDAVLLLQMAMKCADLGHLAASWNVHKSWVARLEEEFFAQGDQEKERGLSVSFLMDRSKPGCSKTQTGFLQFVVIPLFRSVVCVAPLVQPMLDAIMVNYSHWERVEATEAKAAYDGVKLISCKQADVSTKPNSTTGLVDLPDGGDELQVRGDTSKGSAPKRSGRARQRAARWWANVRKGTPSPG